jgi:hypothetical protein
MTSSSASVSASGSDGGRASAAKGPGGAGTVDHIGRDLDHDWPLLGDAAGKRMVDALWGLRRIV